MRMLLKGLLVTVVVMATTQSFAFDLFDAILPPGMGNILRGVVPQVQFPVPPPFVPPSVQWPQVQFPLPFVPNVQFPPFMWAR